MRVNVFYEKENKKELRLLISTCSRIEENESLTTHFLRKYHIE